MRHLHFELISLVFLLGLYTTGLAGPAIPAKVLEPIEAANEFTGEAYGRALAIQSDGKIVMAGYGFNGLNHDFVAARYLTDGTPDKSFAGVGKVLTPIGQENDLAHAMAIQPDGKIILAGFVWNNNHSDFALIRYNSDGSLDKQFNRKGIVVTAVGAGNDFAYAVAVQPDGKILAAGHSENEGDFDLAVVRYHSDGSLDTSFGASGKAFVSLGRQADICQAIALQPDSKILIVGYSGEGFENDFALARLNPDGTLDTTFGTAGKVITHIRDGHNCANAVTLQPDGGIILAGFSSAESGVDFALARYTSTGQLDQAFNESGIVITDIGGKADVCQAVTLQSDAKIVVAGHSQSGDKFDFAMARYNADGSLDASFCQQGKALTKISNGNDLAYAAAIQPDGTIVTGGYGWTGQSNNFTLSQYRPEPDNEKQAAQTASLTLPTFTYDLAYNRPNPFSDQTIISFQLPSTQHVTLKIFNTAGQLVKTLADGSRQAGQYAMTWNGTNADGAPVAGGVYFYRIEMSANAGKSYCQTRRMNLIR